VPIPEHRRVEVKFHLLTGYFEVNAGGMQSSAKSFWNTDRRVNAAKALNCVSLSGRQQANKFRQACAFIMARAGEGWYRMSGRRRIKRGDRVAALGCGIGVVEQVNEKEAHVVLSRLVLRISRRDIIGTKPTCAGRRITRACPERIERDDFRLQTNQIVGMRHGLHKQ